MNCRSSGADNHFTFMFDALATGFRKNEIVEEVSTPISISYTPASHSWSALQTDDSVLQNSHPFAFTWSPELKKVYSFDFSGTVWSELFWSCRLRHCGYPRYLNKLYISSVLVGYVRSEQWARFIPVGKLTTAHRAGANKQEKANNSWYLVFALILQRGILICDKDRRGRTLYVV